MSELESKLAIKVENITKIYKLYENKQFFFLTEEVIIDQE